MIPKCSNFYILGISYKWYGFQVVRSKVRVKVNRNKCGFELYEYLLVTSKQCGGNFRVSRQLCLNNLPNVITYK